VPRPRLPALPARGRRRFGVWPDLALAAVLSLTGQLELSAGGDAGTPDLAHCLLLLAQTLPVAIMRVAPATAVSISMAATLLEALTIVPSNTLSGLLAPLLLVYFLSRRTTGTRLIVVSSLVAVALGVHIVQRPGFAPADLAFAYIFAGAVWLAGRYVRHRELDRLRAEEAVTAERAAAAATLAAAVADERSRIARELHDVVAHGMGVMVVQAAAAEQLLGTDPDAAREPLTTVRETGQGALAEMRRLLGLLRDGDPDHDGGTADGRTAAPQPGLPALPALTERLREAGMPVSIEMTGDLAAVAPGLQLTAYRIVQEALTNALKHSGGAPTRVSLDCGRDALSVTVRNAAGRPLATSMPDGAGHGLVGMKERVRLYGGRLDTEREPDGSFLVRAVLPTRP
jgi:signal transduction histidine kinase